MQSISINSLPEEVHTYVFSYLSYKDLSKTEQVCKQWQRICSEDDLWRQFYKLIDLDYKKSNRQDWNEQVRFLLKKIELGTISKEDFDKVKTLGLTTLFFPKMAIDYTQGLSFHYEKVENVPLECYLATKLLDSQPIFSIDQAGTTYKIIPLKNWNDARIFAIYINNMIFLKNKLGWIIRSFGSCNDIRQTSNHQLITCGLELQIQDSNNISLENIKQDYLSLYNTLRIGWKIFDDTQYPDIEIDHNQFFRFIKESKLIDEDILIRFLISKFNLEQSIKCNRVNEEKIYLLVDKDIFSKFMDIFGFEIDYL
ncbi:F-box-like protein [Candidatus Rubidus massiliensis]|nr:F-box-like protein [Candidatus Rubidus massiliensis]